MRTIADVIGRLPRPNALPLQAPPYTPNGCTAKVMLAVEGMRHHMTNEGWQLQLAHQSAGFTLCGHGFDNRQDVPEIITNYKPGVLVTQDKREWMGVTGNGSRNPRWMFYGVQNLASRPDIFKATVLKDSHALTGMMREAAEELGCHAWIVYYHPDIVHHLAPFTRREHLIRTYHSVDKYTVPPFKTARKGAIISGASSNKVYPMRQQLIATRHSVNMKWLKHPGYHHRGTATPAFLNTLSNYKVSVCTSSIYGYALRKIIESTACGCVPITDLPVDDVLPAIDDWIVRVDSAEEALDAITEAQNNYDTDKANYYASIAKSFYDYRNQGMLLDAFIEKMRRSYE